jgi:integrase
VKAKRYLSPEELARLLTELPTQHRPPVHLLARVGLRPGEAYALRIGKLDPLKRTLLIDTAASGDTKTGQARTVVLPTVIVEELIAHIGRAWNPEALIFPREREQMLDDGNFRSRIFKPAAKRAGLAEGLRVNDPPPLGRVIRRRTRSECVRRSADARPREAFHHARRVRRALGRQTNEACRTA